MGRVSAGILLSQVRLEEKLIFAAAERQNLDLVRLYDKELILRLDEPVFPRVPVVLDRGLVHSRAEYTLRFLDSGGIRTINTYRATALCDNKFHTTMALQEAGVPTLRTAIAFTPTAALQAIEAMGYPVVLKPTTGSWGRLLAKVNDRDAAEAILEHKETLGSYHHSIFYIQEYLPKPGRDIRVFVVGDQVVAAAYRMSAHWITNVARGAQTTPCTPTQAMEDISLRAAKAVGGEILGVDLLETDGALKVIEINVGAEFKGLVEATGVDVPAAIISYVKEQARSLGI